MKKIILCYLCLLFLCMGVNAQSSGEILTIPANPEKGFHWGYALYLPKTLNKSEKVPILLIMTNSGVTNSVEETKAKTLERLHYEASEYPIADELGVPLVMPIVQRTEALYTHALSRVVFVSQEEPFERLDLQVLNMLKDARKQLKKHDIKTKNKFLVTGFSAAGVFAWRWTMLHSEYVLATVTGGALYHMLPIEELNGENLIYPVGVGDMQEYTGKKFNKKAWSKIPIFSYNGVNDDNDTLPYPECFDPQVERPVLEKMLPGKDIFERRAKSLDLLAQLAPNVQTHLYPRLKHEPVTEDVIAFLKLHIGGGALQPFTPSDTSSEKSDTIMNVVKVFWGDSPEVPALHRKYLVDTLVLQTREPTNIEWRFNEYAGIDILCPKTTILTPEVIGSITDDKKSLLLYDLKLTPQQKNLLQHKKCKVRAHEPNFLDISDNLTFIFK